MATEAVTELVGDITYTYRQMTATPSLRLFTKISKLIGPAIAAGQSGESTSNVVSALLANVGEQDLENILKAFAAQSEAQLPGENSKPLLPQFEIHFMDLSRVFSFLVFAMKAQYKSFQSALSAGLSNFAGAGKATPNG
jgi:hypothetical protein